MTGGVAGRWADLGSRLGLDGGLKNGVGGLINALELEVLGVDSILVCKLQDSNHKGGPLVEE